MLLRNNDSVRVYPQPIRWQTRHRDFMQESRDIDVRPGGQYAYDLWQNGRGWQMLKDELAPSIVVDRVPRVGTADPYGRCRLSFPREKVRNFAFSLRAVLPTHHD
jgi:hypothetical protein